MYNMRTLLAFKIEYQKCVQLLLCVFMPTLCNVLKTKQLHYSSAFIDQCSIVKKELRTLYLLYNKIYYNHSRALNMRD